jgi:hypothetical protein
MHLAGRVDPVIGANTGKATILFTQRSYKIFIEPHKNLAVVATRYSWLTNWNSPRTMKTGNPWQELLPPKF